MRKTGWGLALSSVLIMGMLISGAWPSAGHPVDSHTTRTTDATALRLEPSDPDVIANRTVDAVNDRRYRAARRYAERDVVRKMRRWRNDGYRFAGRARNPCYVDRDPDGRLTYTCAGELRRHRRTVGTMFLFVDTSASYNKAYHLVAYLGE